MGKTALLVIDVQQALVGLHPYREGEFLSTIQQLLQTARNNNIEVIYVRHDGGAGDMIEANTEGWNIHEAISPMPGERIFDKNVNSAFRSTGLKEYLFEKGIDRLILTGMQTDYCIDTTCKVAFEYGYSVIIPKGATTTFDNKFLSGSLLVDYYEQKIWSGRFAEVLPVNEVIRKMEQAHE